MCKDLELLPKDITNMIDGNDEHYDITHFQPICDIADSAWIFSEELSLYGNAKAKFSLPVLEMLSNAPDGKLCIVAGINPTFLGEGKPTSTVGDTQALGAHLENVFTCIKISPIFSTLW